ncbi:MAG: hypothetical protein ACRKFN_05765 [Desulfitobacterium sp.]
MHNTVAISKISIDIRSGNDLGIVADQEQYGTGHFLWSSQSFGRSSKICNGFIRRIEGFYCGSFASSPGIV